MERLIATRGKRFISWFVLCLTIVATTRASTAQDINTMSRAVTDVANNANGYNLTVIILAILNGAGYLERRGMFAAAGRTQTAFTGALKTFEALLDKLGRNQRVQTRATSSGMGVLRRELRLTRKVIASRYDTIAERIAEAEKDSTSALEAMATLIGKNVSEGIKAAARQQVEAAARDEQATIERTITTLKALGMIKSDVPPARQPGATALFNRDTREETE